MRSRIRRPIFLVVVTVVAFAGLADIVLNGKRVDRRASNGPEVRVLFIGNSLTYYNEMPWMAEQIAASLGVDPPLRTDSSVRGGASLRYHWEKRRSVRAIRDNRYAFVVLQPQSSEIMNAPEETLRYAKLLNEEIRRSGAKTIVFQTWAPRESSHPQSAYDARYRELARALGATVAPVGAAFEAMKKQKIATLDGGGVHANLDGSYLSACVFVATLYGRSPVGALHTFDVKYDIKEAYRLELETKKLSEANAKALQEAAWVAVREERAHHARSGDRAASRARPAA